MTKFGGFYLSIEEFMKWAIRVSGKDLPSDDMMINYAIAFNIMEELGFERNLLFVRVGPNEPYLHDLPGMLILTRCEKLPEERLKRYTEIRMDEKDKELVDWLEEEGVPDARFITVPCR